MDVNPNIVNVSPHVLMDVITCETKAWVRHVKGRTTRGDAIKAVAGQAFHAGVATFLDPVTTEGVPGQRARLALESFHHVYDPAFQRIPAEQLEPSLTPANLHALIARWMQMHPPAAVPWKRVLMVEEAFVARAWNVREGGDVIPVPPTDPEPRVPNAVLVRLIVRPDAIVQGNTITGDDRIRWLDTKTTGWRISDASWKRNLRLSLQAQLYSDAVVQRFQGEALYGGWFNAIELRALPQGPKGRKGICKAHNREFSQCHLEHECTDHKQPIKICAPEHARTEFVECLTTPVRVQQAVEDATKAIATFMRMIVEERTPFAKDAVEMGVPLRLPMQGTSNGSCRWCPAAEWCDTADGRPLAALESFFVFEPWPVETGKRA